MFQHLPKRGRRKRKKLAQAARCWAAGQLDTQQGNAHETEEFDAALAALGLCSASDSPEQPAAPPDKCYLWPCNLPTWRLWHGLQTQWRVGAGGREGLCYASVIGWLRRVAGIGKKQLPEVFAELQAMERAALAVWAEKRS